MLRQLKLVNFRQHENLTLDFEDGLVVLRGKNEAGKSTIILGVLYALFGAKVLPLPLAQTVTWGKSDSTVSSQVIIDVEGEQYLFKRGKSGAECHHSGGSVTGQNEVSNFAAEILGADYATVSKLMIANQNNLRGALEEGPSKVSQYIEDLSGMDLFDTLLTLVSENLLTGNTGVFESALVDAKDVVDSLSAGAVEPDWGHYNETICNLEIERTSTQDIATASKPLLDDSKSKLLDLKTKAAAHNQAVSQVELLKAQVEKVKREFEAETELANSPLSTARIKYFETAVNDSAAVAKQIAIHKVFTKLVYPEDTHWEGTKADFDLFVDTTESDKSRVHLEQASLADEIKRLKSTASKAVTIDTVCPACGQEFADAESKKAHIAQLEKEIADAKVELVAKDATYKVLAKQAKDIADNLSVIATIRQVATPFLNFALVNADLVNVDDNWFPPRLSWKGDIPDVDTDLGYAQKELDTLKAQDLSIQMAKVKAEGLWQRGLDIAKQIDGFDIVEVDTEALTRLETYTHELEEKYQLATWKVSSIGSKIDAINVDRNNARTQYDIALAGVEAAKQNYDKAQSQLETLLFNNALLKKIRSARPLVADKLWSTVLLSVSSMFSQMRGTPSIVTKGKDGFAVNGEPIAGLSGSTLDILGLALRSSLVKSFLPHTAMMVLDEPAAAMDDDRAINMLGFIAASGFTQTLLITHDDISEQFSDQIITL